MVGHSSSAESETFRAALFRLVCYVVTSARGLVDEPKLYGPMRLITAASELIGIMEDLGLADEFLKGVSGRIDRDARANLLKGDQAFIEFLDSLILLLAKKVKETPCSDFGGVR